MPKEIKIYDVLDISRYIINYSVDNNYEISNLKLQKLLYYAQSAFLCEKNRKCFQENIINWSYGPVVEETYREYRNYGYESIPKQTEYNTIIYDQEKNVIRLNKVQFNEDIIDLEDKKLIQKVIRSYNTYTPFKLVEKTHEEDPWKLTSQNEIISTDVIEKYYSNNKSKVYGEDDV